MMARLTMSIRLEASEFHSFVAEGSAIGAKDGAGRYELCALFDEALDKDFGPRAICENQIVNCADVVDTFANGLKGYLASAFLKPVNFGHGEARHD